MKKLTAILLIAALTLALTGCGETDPGVDNRTAAPDTTLAPPDATITPPSETVTPPNVSELTDSKAKEIIEKYYALSAQLLFAGLPMTLLELTEHENMRVGHYDEEGNRLFWYGGYLYEDYKNGMLQYVSEELFKREFMKDFAVSENGVLTGGGGGATGFRLTVEELTLISKEDDVYRYRVKRGWQDISPFVYFGIEQVDIIFNGQKYVVHNITESEEKVEGNQVGFRPGGDYMIDEKAGTISISGFESDIMAHGTHGLERNANIEEFAFLNMFGNDSPEHFRFEFVQNSRTVSAGTIKSGMTLRVYYENNLIGEYLIID
jgi:hypothetical protein